MNPDIQALRDIHDSLGNPWWPLAPGWWLIGLLLVVAVALWRRYRSTRLLLPPIPLIRLGDWRWDARRELRSLSRRRQGDTTKIQIAALAELLKRIAMARHGRSACAGLHGQAWLEWLSAQDPDGFDWCREAQVLIRAPYAPDLVQDGAVSNGGVQADRQARLERMITATERWIIVRPKPHLGRDSAGRSHMDSRGQPRGSSTSIDRPERGTDERL